MCLLSCGRLWKGLFVKKPILKVNSKCLFVCTESESGHFGLELLLWLSFPPHEHIFFLFWGEFSFRFIPVFTQNQSRIHAQLYQRCFYFEPTQLLRHKQKVFREIPRWDKALLFSVGSHTLFSLELLSVLRNYEWGWGCRLIALPWSWCLSCMMEWMCFIIKQFDFSFSNRKGQPVSLMGPNTFSLSMRATQGHGSHYN